ncbi:MAG: hypothetical protein IJ375_07020 [Oscillospiraceae bacterium]|nr:hypothetical protein [Oscillospiraceae bacterium]
MRKSIQYILYGLTLLVTLVLPAERTDVGELLPVELVSVSAAGGKVTIRTDTGNSGTGENVTRAYRDLEESASGKIFLDTVDYLVLEESKEIPLENLRQYLKSGIRVCRGEEGLNLEEAALYLATHRPQVRLKELNTVTDAPVLVEMENGFALLKKDRKK